MHQGDRKIISDTTDCNFHQTKLPRVSDVFLNLSPSPARMSHRVAKPTNTDQQVISSITTLQEQFEPIARHVIYTPVLFCQMNQSANMSVINLIHEHSSTQTLTEFGRDRKAMFWVQISFKLFHPLYTNIIILLYLDAAQYIYAYLYREL